MDHRLPLPPRETTRQMLSHVPPESRERFIEELVDAQYRAEADGDPYHVSRVIQYHVVGMMFFTDPNREALERRADRLLAESRAREARKRLSKPERTHADDD